ncbi:MAG TPA: SRPBCC domain-containing protein [Candidatus Limnocylindria bacterium]
MTEQKALKRRVRARMARTGERYTTARSHLVPADRKADAPAAKAVRAVPPPGMTSDDSMRSSTGRTWAEWIGMLDAWGAADRPHRDIARWLNRDRGVDGWWSQQITVGYEIAIGRRVVGQRSDGRFSATATRTIGAPVEEVMDAVLDENRRAAWLPNAPLTTRESKAERTARFDWEGGSSRAVFWFEPMGDTKSRVAMEHERLPDKATTDEMKAYWRAALGRLKDLVEG